MTSFPLKLRALRQAVTTTLSEAGCRCSLREAGRMMLEDLAALNDRDVRLFQQLYHRLLVTAESPSCREGVVEELAEIGIQLFNFMDIIFEVVLLRIQAGAEPQICPRPGGFLHHLMAVISSVSAVTRQSRPRADQCLLLVRNAMLLFLESVFTLEESEYSSPGSLFRAVWEIFQSHAEDLLDRLEDI
ncbi:mitoguardin 1-like [Hoplias malabaricus]|uniref:mitoguardin 1-like n=1 Tax=Hoplias malabaricus TaxID=27720 RepID=UPI003461C571